MKGKPGVGIDLERREATRMARPKKETTRESHAYLRKERASSSSQLVCIAPQHPINTGAEGPGEGVRPTPGAATANPVLTRCSVRRRPSVNAHATETPLAVPSEGHFSLYSPSLWMTLRKASLEREFIDISL